MKLLHAIHLSQETESMHVSGMQSLYFCSCGRSRAFCYDCLPRFSILYCLVLGQNFQCHMPSGAETTSCGS